MFIFRAIDNLVRKIEEKKREVTDDFISLNCTALFPLFKFHIQPALKQIKVIKFF